ncbi:hypothetical protein B5F36_10465 [Anaerofilum sp. An201]|nr:DUF2513 domain-containing protein [Anaerofilum sp. An201]OUP02644.1 hypothetical protein B5F36_10465 [Anaerofilum sp. An201]
MRLDAECVRDVLFTIESADLRQRITVEWLVAKIERSFDEVWYTCIKLQEAGYIELKSVKQLRSPLPVISVICGLTYQGHEFLNQIRDDTNWAKIKEIGKKAGVVSLGYIAEIAKAVTTSAVTAALQGNR